MIHGETNVLKGNTKSVTTYIFESEIIYKSCFVKEKKEKNSSVSIPAIYCMISDKSLLISVQVSFKKLMVF